MTPRDPHEPAFDHNGEPQPAAWIAPWRTKLGLIHVLAGANVSPIGFRVMAVLIARANAETGLATVGNKRLATEAGKRAKFTVTRAVGELVKDGWLTIEIEGGGRIANTYRPAWERALTLKEFKSMEGVTGHKTVTGHETVAGNKMAQTGHKTVAPGVTISCQTGHQMVAQRDSMKGNKEGDSMKGAVATAPAVKCRPPFVEMAVQLFRATSAYHRLNVASRDMIYAAIEPAFGLFADRMVACCLRLGKGDATQSETVARAYVMRVGYATQRICRATPEDAELFIDTLMAVAWPLARQELTCRWSTPDDGAPIRIDADTIAFLGPELAEQALRIANAPPSTTIN